MQTHHPGARLPIGVTKHSSTLPELLAVSARLDRTATIHRGGDEAVGKQSLLLASSSCPFSLHVSRALVLFADLFFSLTPYLVRKKICFLPLLPSSSTRHVSSSLFYLSSWDIRIFFGLLPLLPITSLSTRHISSLCYLSYLLGIQPASSQPPQKAAGGTQPAEGGFAGRLGSIFGGSQTPTPAAVSYTLDFWR
jgi:hypothetical protein